MASARKGDFVVKGAGLSPAVKEIVMVNPPVGNHRLSMVSYLGRPFGAVCDRHPTTEKPDRRQIRYYECRVEGKINVITVIRVPSTRPTQ